MIMLDLETLGTAPGCIIASIGAVAFDRKGVYEDHRFYGTVSIRNQPGLEIDPNVLEWWLRQSDAARNSTFPAQPTYRSLQEAMTDFARWYTMKRGKTPEIWSNGATFDIPIIEHAMRVSGVEVPWSYRDVRCFRTLAALVPVAFESKGVKHNALVDAVYQAKQAYIALNGVAHSPNYAD